MQGDGAEPEGAEEDGEPLSFVDGPGEDDGGLAGELVEKVYKVKILIFVGKEQVGLEQGRYGLVFVGRYGDAGRVRQRCSLECFDFGCHGCGEQICSALAREDLEDLVDDRAEV